MNIGGWNNLYLNLQNKKRKIEIPAYEFPKR